MKSSIPGMIFTVVLLAVPALACGSDKEERGIDTQSEVAVPVDREELAETEEERDRDLVDELQE